MTDVEKIYIELNNREIDTFNITLRNIKSASYCDEDGCCSVAVDENQIKTPEEFKVVLLHEQGHCETNSFYGVHTHDLERARLEFRADRYVAETKITKCAIDKAHQKEGLIEVWEFAEYFGVTVEYMKRLMGIHFQMEFMD